MTSENDKLIDKIRKLLAKAERTTPEEAEALTEHAERLMMKYSIDQAMIDARREKGQREEVGRKVVIVGGVYRQALEQLAYQIASGLGTFRVISSRTLNDKSQWSDCVVLVGFESDVEQASILFASLQMQAVVAMRKWYRDLPYKTVMSGMEKYKHRRSFMFGFAIGVGQRLTRNRKVATEEAGTGAEIVLRDRFSMVNDFIATHMPDLTHKQSRMNHTGAIDHGITEGHKANTGETQVNDTSSRKAVR